MTAKTKRRKSFKPGRGYTKRDWDAVSDNPRWSRQGVRKAKPFADAFPDIADGIKRSRGHPRVEAPEEAVTLRLDPSTLAKFRAKGEDWRARMVMVLDRAKG